MNKIIKNFLPKFVLDIKKLKEQKAEYLAWVNREKQGPSPHIRKQQIIAEYGSKFNCNTLVETGTFMGDMIHAQKDNFHKLISIELSNDLFRRAVQRFNKLPKVKLFQGDSGIVLKEIVEAEIKENTLFWLDGHYSGGITARGDKDCPIFEEMNSIFSKKTDFQHVLLIDDARCFIGEGDYPSLDQLKNYVKHLHPGYKMEVEHDVIRFTL